MAEPEVTETELQEAERRARAALHGEPPTLTPSGEGPGYLLEARPAVIEFVREVGPPVVLNPVGEIRRLRVEQERLMGRLRNVETWSLEQ